MQVIGALSKLVVVAMKWQAIVVVNLFMISVVGYYTIHASTLNVRFSVVRKKEE